MNKNAAHSGLEHYYEVPGQVKRRYFLSGVVITLLIVALFYFGYMMIPVSFSVNKPDTISTIRKAKEIERLVQRHFLFEYDEAEQTDVMFLGQVAALGDKYSTYYTKDEYRNIMQGLEGEYVGLGVTIGERADDGAMVIIQVQKDSPAYKKGVHENDIIRKVNGESVIGWSTSQVTEKITSDEDGEVDLVIFRESEDKEYEFTIALDDIEKDTVEHHMMDKKTGYIQIKQFAGVTEKQFADALQDLQAGNMKTLIIDLRNNSGGLVRSACGILETILPKGTLVYQEDKNGKRTYTKSETDSTLDLPMVILVNEKTASAAEIFTGAMMDYEAATVVGERTFGKGIVQNYYRLSDGSAVKLTVTKYFTPKGRDIHQKGIIPDVYVKVNEEEESVKDIQLEKALEILRESEKK